MPVRIFASVAELRPLIGQEVGVSEWLRIEQPRVNAFAEATDDRQWIHLDAERASRESPYGAPIAHGFLTLSLLSPLVLRTVQIDGVGMTINYGLNRVRFPSAAPVGSQIRAHVTLQALDDLPDSVQITWGVTVELDGSSKPCCVAEWLVRLYPDTGRPA